MSKCVLLFFSVVYMKEWGKKHMFLLHVHWSGNVAFVFRLDWRTGGPSFLPPLTANGFIYCSVVIVWGVCAHLFSCTHTRTTQCIHDTPYSLGLDSVPWLPAPAHPSPSLLRCLREDIILMIGKLANTFPAVLWFLGQIFLIMAFLSTRGPYKGTMKASVFSRSHSVLYPINCSINSSNTGCTLKKICLD